MLKMTTAICCVVCTPLAYGQNIHYVDMRAPSGGDGTSWGTPFQSLEDALAAAKQNDQVWVAGGTYEPVANADETSSFHIPDRVHVYGGFKGVESSLGERNHPFATPSILEGERAPAGSAGNIDNIVTISGRQGVVLDGFVIQNGWAGTGSASENGSGVSVIDSSVALRNLWIHDCAAVGIGGAVGITGDSSVTIEDSVFEENTGTFGGAIGSEVPFSVTECTFIENASVTHGGAIYVSGQGVSDIDTCTFEFNRSYGDGGAIAAELDQMTTTTAMIVTDCEFLGNIADGPNTDAGAILFRFEGLHEVRGCRFIGNYAGGDGGAIQSAVSDGWSTTIENSMFSGNIAVNLGGGIHDAGGGDLWLVNSTVMGNNTGNVGGGLYTHAGDLVVANTILWGNDNVNSAGQGYSDQFGFNGAPARTMGLYHTLMQSWTDLAAVTDSFTSNADPMLVDAEGADGIFGTPDDDCRVASGSPAIDAGNNLFLSASVNRDVNGALRYRDDTGMADVGVGDGVNPIVDIGAAEFQGTTVVCFADCDGNGALNLDDIDCFVAGFLASDQGAADCDSNGSLNLDDIDCFVASFLGGCI